MRKNLKISLLVIALGFFVAGSVFAQAGLPVPNAGFDITGFIQKATRANVGAVPVNRRLQGGTLTVNGIDMIVPNNSIVQMPAAAFSWGDLFGPLNSTPVGTYNPARLPVPAGRTGLALLDNLRLHYPAYEVRVVGNIIRDPVTGGQKYIVGMILPVAQEQLGAGSGYINYIDYDGTVLGGGVGGAPGIRGRFRVGGIMGDPNTGTLCELNDPVGRFGDAHSPDPRFTVDYTNPTVTTANGYPVCIHRGALTDPDPDCPTTNRPLNDVASVDPNQPFDPFLAQGAPLKTFTMPTPNGPGGTTPDPFKQVPLMVGDWIDYSGTLMLLDQSALGTSVPPLSDPANMFVSVHTVTAHLSVKTQPGTLPAYVMVEEMLFGVGDGNGAPTVAGIVQETSTRALLVAFTTDSDPNNTNNCVSPPDPGLPGGAIFGVHVNPTTGAETELLVSHTVGGVTTSLSTESQPTELCIDDPVRGRMRLQLAKNPKPPVPGLLGNAVNPPGSSSFNFYREYVLKLTDNFGNNRTLQLPDQTALKPDGTALTGLIAGQFRLPIFEYIFGEGTIFGQPVPPFNFSDFGFLAIGSGRLDGTTGPIIGRLDPFPTFGIGP